MIGRPSKQSLVRFVRRAGFALATITGLVAVMILTLFALHIPPVSAIEAIWDGAIGNSTIGTLVPITVTLTKTAPLILTGLSVVIAWRAGMFSIGAEGQLLVGALAATALWSALGWLYPPILISLMTAAGAVAGAAWSGAAAWLRLHRNVPEVISTIMLNYVALDVVGALVTAPGALHGKTQPGPHSDPLPAAIAMPNILAVSHNAPQAHLHLGIAIAFLAVPCVGVYLYHTRAGFGLRVLGQNREAARVARFAIDRLQMQAMLVSGALSGLAGAVELLGVTGRLGRDFSPGWGYTAIPVALLGTLTPFGTMSSALFFGALAAGVNNAQRTVGVPSFVAYVVQATTVLAIVSARAWRHRKSGGEAE